MSGTDKVKLSNWDYPPSADLYNKYKSVYDNPKYYNQSTGAIHWPDGDGFLEGTISKKMIPKGTIFKRIGYPSGEFLGNTLDSFESRSLAPHSEKSPVYYYKLMEDFEMTTGIAAPWFEQPGGAVQFVKYDSSGNKVKVQQLIDDFVIEDVTNILGGD